MEDFRSRSLCVLNYLAGLKRSQKQIQRFELVNWQVLFQKGDPRILLAVLISCYRCEVAWSFLV